MAKLFGIDGSSAEVATAENKRFWLDPSCQALEEDPSLSAPVPSDVV